MGLLEAITISVTAIGGIASMCYTYLQLKRDKPATTQDKDISKIYRDLAVLKTKIEALEKQNDQVGEQLGRLHDILLKLLED